MSAGTASSRFLERPGSAARAARSSNPFPAGAMLVLHSDGIATHWDLAAYPGLRPKQPSLVAGVLFRDFGRRRDDATALVVKERTRA
jgi:hypothetical protein